MNEYVLPDLPYPLDALEPWCPAETLELHHSKHHAAYVKEANAAVTGLAEADPSNKPLIAGLREALTFNVSGHMMHSLFWKSLSPTEGKPSGALAERIEKDFGSVDACTKSLAAACVGVHGSGWGVLALDPFVGELRIATILDHHNGHVPHACFLAAVDVWEHAYYLTYRNERAAWVDAAVKHLDWESIATRLDAATSAIAESGDGASGNGSTPLRESAGVR